MTHTTLASWALVIWRSLESYHLDPRPAFNAAGIDVSGLQTPGQRVPYAAMQALWREAVARTKDPCFGLQTVDFIHSTTFHALGYAAMASNTLEDALCRVIRYGRLVATVFGAELRDEGQTLRLTEAAALPGDCPEAQDASVDAAIAAIVQICRELRGPELSPLEVGISHAAPPCADRFYGYFRAPVRFGTAKPYLVLDKAEARAPLPTANAELALANEQVIRDHLARFDKASMAMQVRVKIAEQLPSGRVTESSVAAALHVSPRSMQRRLQDEGTSFRAVFDDMRMELAVRYLGHAYLALNEISYLLGYSEPASFTRAFRRWKGVSPSEFRSQTG